MLENRTIAWVKPRYRRPRHLNALARAEARRLRRAGFDIFDGACVRLCDDNQIQRCGYFDVLATNRNADHPWVHRLGYDEQDHLLSWSQSQFANSLGAGCFVISNDGYVLLSRQPANNAVAAGLWAPTSAGSTDPEDVRPTLYATFEQTAARELHEESGLRLSTTVMAAYRNENAGGKPEAICMTHLERPAHTLTPPRGYAWIDLGRLPDVRHSSDPVRRFIGWFDQKSDEVARRTQPLH